MWFINANTKVGGKYNSKQTFNMAKYLIIIFLILLIPFGLYFYFFYNQLIGSPVDWGYFGNFYGGVLTPIITAITTILLAYISITISKRSETYHKEILFLEYKKGVINEIMKHQKTLNSIKSQLLVKEILVNIKKNSKRDEYDNLCHKEKMKINKKEFEKQNNDDIVFSLRDFFAVIIYDITEIVKYFESFGINNSLLFEKSNLSSNIFYSLNSELLLLYNLLQECLQKGEIVFPNNFELIEKELSRALVQISNTNH